jgi:hypothetical protein
VVAAVEVEAVAEVAVAVAEAVEAGVVEEAEVAAAQYRS